MIGSLLITMVIKLIILVMLIMLMLIMFIINFYVNNLINYSFLYKTWFDKVWLNCFFKDKTEAAVFGYSVEQLFKKLKISQKKLVVYNPVLNTLEFYKV